MVKASRGWCPRGLIMEAVRPLAPFPGERGRVRGLKKENPLVEYRPLMIAHGARAHDPDRYVNFARLGKIER